MTLMEDGQRRLEPACPSGRTVSVAHAPYSIFLAVSWTWCIGMYLPVLLVRDMGLWGWVIFAAPNVVGAAALAWILPTATASRRLAEEHREACVWFSIITIAFHVFFIGWMIRLLLGPFGVALAAAAVAIAWVCFAAGGDNAGRWCAAAVFLISLILAAILLFDGRLSLPSAAIKPGAALALGALAPVCIVGFFLCPYLDLTFHRVRGEASPNGGRLAFGLGFGVFFLIMILFTLGYSLPLLAGAAGLLAICVGIHMAMQSGFTIAAHLREIFRPESRQPHQAAALIVCILIAALLPAIARDRLSWFGSPRPEVIYRAFMGFYGLIFPAYVWVNMRSLSTDPPSPRLRHRRHMIFLIAVLAAGPFFAVGFLGRQWVWLFPGVAILLAARFVENFRRPVSEEPRAG